MHKSYLSFNLMPPLRLHHKLWVNSVSFRRAICIHLASIKHSNKNSSDCYRDDLIQLCNLLQCMFYLKGKQGRRVRGLRLQWAILQEDITWWLLANSSCSSFLWSQAGGVSSARSALITAPSSPPLFPCLMHQTEIMVEWLLPWAWGISPSSGTKTTLPLIGLLPKVKDRTESEETSDCSVQFSACYVRDRCSDTTPVRNRAKSISILIHSPAFYAFINWLM